MQRWSGECSVAQCTVLCSPFPSSWHHPEHEHFFNHSRESRAEPSGGRVSHCSVCSHHTPPPPLSPPRHCHTTQLHVSSFPHITISPCFLLLSLTVLTLSLSYCFFPPSSPLFSFPTSSPRPVSIIPFAHLCDCVICFFPFIAPPSLSSPSLSLLWMNRDFLFTTGNAVPALLTNQQEEISARDEPGCLLF